MTPLFGSGKLIDSEIQNDESVATVYALLARLWVREIDSPLLAGMAEEPLVSALSQLNFAFPGETLEQLATEYCALFIGPKNALLPMQSVWEKTQLGGQSASSVAKFAELIGYSISARALWDHLGVQLDLMSHLVLATRSREQHENDGDVACEMAKRLSRACRATWNPNRARRRPAKQIRRAPLCRRNVTSLARAAASSA